MGQLHYFDFELKIERKGDQYAARVIGSPRGEASNIFTLPFSEDRLELLVLKMGRDLHISTRRIHSMEMEAARELGGKLFEAVFGGEVLACLRSSLEEISEGTGLRLKLRFQEVAELADLPWEFLFDPAKSRFFAQSNLTPIVRYIEMPERIKPLTIDLPLNILVMTSSPADYRSLDVELEKSSLKKALEPLSREGKVSVEWLEKPTLSSLLHCLREGTYHIFHFIGHGGFDRKADEGVLVIEDEKGRGWQAEAHRIGTLLHDHQSLRLAVLNSCEGARNSRTDPFAGVAATLIRQGIPAVVAMQFEISDEAAITFAGEFYSALAGGYPVDAAVAEARKAVYFQPNDIEWGTPVLYLRSPDGVLFNSVQKKKSKGRKQEIAAEEAQLHAQKEAEQEQKRREKEARQAELSALYSKGAEALEAQEWQTAIKHFNDILTLDPGYRDAGARLKEAERQLELAKEKERQKLEEQEAMGNNPSYFKGDDLPVEQVSWNDVQQFIQRLSEKEGTNKYRLPSEAEWEYAARAGTTTSYSFGDDESKLGDYAWFTGNSGSKTHPVGQKKPNTWGLYDMHGNVWEWMQDIYHNNYNGAPADGSAWEGDGSDRVDRGGSWSYGARTCRSANRNYAAPGPRNHSLGFRLLRIL